MIRLKDVEKTYENGTEALQGISFTIEDGALHEDAGVSYGHAGGEGEEINIIL